ncbi:hypothetical protein GX51_01765 [Blastomyces parvus]|uniref:DASH complex subunit Hsk3 like-domain-containing protein n=1 Tax=Blastomyces parvus TaxID=2060905 RepID=A0A2B7X733_9EURO|nr:hypothetical protein GX51_01765 [Blastomyces parvus]
MPPPYHQRQQSFYNNHNNHNNNSNYQSHSRTSSATAMAGYTANLTNANPSSTSTSHPFTQQQPSMSTAKTRQYAHLHSQLAQLNAHLADMENLMRMTAAQAGDMRFLGGYVGGLFMGAAKVLGEEGGAKAGDGGGDGSGGAREGED